MKILSVKFLNLNSLKGEHSIRFDRSPFIESGLFGITGATGAGKTTILDAITVALYGCVHRHGRNPEESITRFTSESFSDVEFEVKTVQYRARWSQRRSRGKIDGTLQTSKMELAEVSTGNIIVSHPVSTVQNKIVEICGLDYSQFLRSVMLSQGDFTRFLKSSENERSDLLERITDTGIYSDISGFIYQKNSLEETKLKGLKAKMNDVQLLSEDAKKTIEQDILALNEQADELSRAKLLTEKKLAWLENIKALEDKKKDYESRLVQLKLQADEKKPAFEKLQLHNRAVVHKPALAELKLLQINQQDLQTQIEKAEEQLPSLQLDWEAIDQQRTEINLHYHAARIELSTSEPLLEGVVRKDTELNSLKKQLQENINKAADAKSEIQKAKIAYENKNAELGKCQSSIAQLNNWLATHIHERDIEKELPLLTQLKKEYNESQTNAAKLATDIDILSEKEKKENELLNEKVITIDQLKTAIVNLTDRNTNTATYIEEELAGKPLEELEELHNELPILINKLNEQYRLSIEHTKALERNGVVEKELNRLGIHLETEKKTYDRLATEKAEAEKNLIDLRQLVELQIRIQNYDADRQQLELEKPCLLCGSLHHPYKANNYHSAVSAAEQKRNELQIKFNQLNNFLSEASIAINTLTNQIAVLNEEVTRITAAINDHALSFKTNNIDLLPMLSVDDSEQIQLLVSEYRHNHQLLQKKIKTIKDLQKTVAEINTGLSIKQRELLTEENKITLTKEQLKNIAVEKKRLIQEHEITFEKIRTTMISATNFLLKYNIRLDVKGFADAEVALQERSNFYQNSLHQLQTNKLAEATLQTESEHLANKIKDLLEHETSLQAIVEQERSFVDEKATERKNIFGEKDPSAERKRMNEALQQFARRMEEMDLALNDKQEMIKVLEGKVEEWRRSLQRALDEFEKLTSILLSKLKAEGIDDIDELVSNILPDNEAQSIHTIQQAINTNIATNTGILNSTVEEYNREIVKNLTTEQTEALQEISVNQEKLISELNQQIGGLQKVLEKDIDDANKYHQIAGLAAVQEKEFARWNKLCSLIGSADGKKFSRFAQGLTLARLTELANRHLKKFSDRYQILKSIEKDLELQIIDAYQADVVRPMNTLSGGESFLVSLSLALGLSDLAGRKVQIQSLFIDEGFGTLDAETLDVAISALENLQVSGKMIGIISHVEALKERIGTQIEVSKQQGGYSQIAIRSYGKPVMNI